MSHYYTNANTPGEVVELDERSARLDNLDNWTHHTSREDAEKATSGAATGYVNEQGVLRRAGMVAAPTIAPRRDDAVAAPASTAPKVSAKAAADKAADADRPAARR